jgi:lipid II:glycine glycyltransferase (peptidoglycan interpeptide bridge formation enzyme)
MERRRRRTIQKAMDLGVTVDMLGFDEGIVELRRLQGFTSERLKQRGALVDFGPVRTAEEDPAGELVRAGRADLAGARHGGNVVSVSLYTKMNGLVYSTLAGHAPEAYDSQAYTLLLWTVMRRYREEHQRQLNIGGVPVSASEESSPDHGLYSYKAGLGAVRQQCTSARKILRPLQHKVIEKARVLLSR